MRIIMQGYGCLSNFESKKMSAETKGKKENCIWMKKWKVKGLLNA